MTKEQIIQIEKLIKQALEEDLGKRGDVTSDLLISAEKKSRAVLLLKESGVISGLEIVGRVFKQLDNRVKFAKKVKDGSIQKKGKIIAEVFGSTRALLKAERTALNILQRMSGIATHTNLLKKKLGNPAIKILDTRKTTPNFRLFEKLAVRQGGGTNHRTGLYDMILIKDNHIEANNGIINTLEILKKKIKKRELKYELEVKTISQLKEVLQNDPGIIDIIMLDNFKISKINEAVKLINGRYKIELSGGINLYNISKYRNVKGIDYISCGSLTHSLNSLDISLDFIT